MVLRRCLLRETPVGAIVMSLGRARLFHLGLTYRYAGASKAELMKIGSIIADADKT
jgi:hypothetical protein